MSQDSTERPWFKVSRFCCNPVIVVAAAVSVSGISERLLVALLFSGPWRGLQPIEGLGGRGTDVSSNTITQLQLRR